MFGNTGINDFGFGVRRISNLRGTVQGLESQWNAEERERRRQKREREANLRYEMDTRHKIDKLNDKANEMEAAKQEREAKKAEREREQNLQYEQRIRNSPAFRRAYARNGITRADVIDSIDVQRPRSYDAIHRRPIY